MLKAVCLDMGETLVSYHPPSHTVLGAFLHGRGIEVSDRAIQRAYLSAIDRYYVEKRKLFATLGARSLEEQQPLFEEFDRMLLANLGIGSRSDVGPADVQAAFAGVQFAYVLSSDVRPALADLKARGLRLAVVSNWGLDLADRCADLGVADYFDVIVGSAEVGFEKPDPAIFHSALDRLKVVPKEAWHVGDVYSVDVLGARAAGITPVLLDRHDLQPEVDCLRARSLHDLVQMVHDAMGELPVGPPRSPLT